MRKRVFLVMAACTLAGRAQTGGTKIGIINIQDAIIRTEEGQKTAKSLQDKYAPRQTQLERSKRELDDLQAQLSKGRNTMSEDARNLLIRQIDQKNKALTRDNEDATAEFQQEEGKLINAIGQKMMSVIDKYAKEKGYAIILDISSPQSPVLYAVNTVDITNDIVTLYDKSQGGGSTATPAAAPSASAPAPAVRPPVTRPPLAVPKTAPAKPPATPARP
ncbi:MAG: OmpH family outer membrane protein [Acidobacteria bacterium]|nr:OmpH family outer membrane protein [Acidobacteriota bacterium]